MSAFGSALSVRDLRLCRNACAHINVDSLNLVQRARVRYSNTGFHHPSDAIYWVDAGTRDFLWKTWIDEMLTVSDIAIS